MIKNQSAFMATLKKNTTIPDGVVAMKLESISDLVKEEMRSLKETMFEVMVANDCHQHRQKGGGHHPQNSTNITLLKAPSLDIVEYAISAGGKRVRPLITLLSARMAQQLYTPTHTPALKKHTLLLAACVELVHTASLLHDDVLDNAVSRRGRVCAHERFGVRATILAGDFILAKVYQALLTSDDAVAVQWISHVIMQLSKGEMSTLLRHGDMYNRWDTYLEGVYAKTSSLFEASSFLGAHGALWIDQYTSNKGKTGNNSDSNEDTRSGRHDFTQQVARYGCAFGQSFQYIDDCLDYYPVHNDKTAGCDFRQGIATLPVLMSWQHGALAHRDFWKRTMGVTPTGVNPTGVNPQDQATKTPQNSDINTADQFTQALNILHQDNAWQHCITHIDEQCDTAQSAILPWCSDTSGCRESALALVELVKVSRALWPDGHPPQRENI